MKVYTYLEARQKLQREMDIEDEVFIEPQELIDYFNEAIDEAEAIIHNLHEDYFLKNDYIALASGTQEYDMPTDIYANKIRMLYYDNNSTRYKLERVKLEEINYLEKYGYRDYYSFSIQNSSAGTGRKIVLHPTPQETSAQNLRVWYIRNANRVVDDNSEIDIPEFMNFIWAYVKKKVAEKEVNPLLAVFAQDVEKQELRMRTTLDEMVLDNDKTIDPDLSFYHEFMDEDYWGAY